MSKRLFVGGLPYDMTEEKLQEVFSACGRVEKVKIMVDRATGRSKGFGFLEMATDLEGNAAILKFDNTQLGPRKISVKEARPAESHHRPAGGPKNNDQRSRGRQPNDNRPKDRRFSNNNGNGGNGHPSSAPRHEAGFGEARPARPPQAFGERQNRGSFGRPNNGSGGPGSQTGFGGGYGRRPRSNAGPSQAPTGAPRERSDWRSELGFGTAQPQRRDFRRSGAQRDQRRSSGPRQLDDNFGNR